MKRFLKTKSRNLAKAMNDVVTDSPNEPATILVPLHPHELHKVNPLCIYKEYEGHWKCDNCNNESGPYNYPYNCKQCSYDICKTCSEGVMLQAHEHPLFHVNTSQLFHQHDNGVWKCAACSRSSNEIGQTHSLHCSSCDYDLCVDCAKSINHPIHCHPLDTAKTSIAYPSTGGSWACDFCGRTSRFYERYARHCLHCQFDACADCLKEYHVPSHPHPLVRADSNFVYQRFAGGWRCDNCGSLHQTPDDNKPWHCVQCEHDLCDECMYQLNNHGIYNYGDDPGPPPGSRALTRNSAIRNPHLAVNQVSEPEEPRISSTVAEQNANPPEAVEEGDECIICTERPKNATIIHGDTGHLCCCWQCAQVVKMRGDPCPICRMPIDKVIRQYKA